jgi:tetratricopeptide (TPR) repeat protein
MRTKLLLGLLGLSSSMAAAGGAPGDFDQLIKQAHVALTKFDPESARALLSQACRPEEFASDTSVRTAVCEAETGAVEEAAGHADGAELHYRRALSIWGELAPDHAAYHAATLMNLGSLYRTQRRNAEAENMLTQAFELVRGLSEESGGRDRLLAVVSNRLGGFYSESDTPERGRALLNEAIPMLRAPALSNPAELAYARNLLGMLDLRNGDYRAGESSLREAVSVATDALGDSHPDTAVYEANLALALYNEGQYTRAEVLLNRARYIVETRLPGGSLRLGRILGDLTRVETALGQFSRAEADGKQSLAILSQWRDAGSPEIAVENVALATLYLRERRIAEAEEILPAAVALERRLAAVDPYIPDRRVLAEGIQRLAELRALEQNWHDAQALYSEAIAIYESTPGFSRPGMAPVLLEYADVLKHCGAPRAEVKDIEAKARAMKT